MLSRSFLPIIQIHFRARYMKVHFLRTAFDAEGRALLTSISILTLVTQIPRSVFLLWLSLSAQQVAAQEYRYSPFEKPDPFDPSFLIKTEQTAVHPLLSNHLESMKLTGTIIGENPLALVWAPGEDQKYRIYTLRIGDKLGKRAGTVISILRDRLVVREPLDVKGSAEGVPFRDVIMTIVPASYASSTGLGSQESEQSVIDATELRRQQRESLLRVIGADVLSEESDSSSVLVPTKSQLIQGYGDYTSRSGSVTLSGDSSGSNIEATSRTIEARPLFSDGNGSSAQSQGATRLYPLRGGPTTLQSQSFGGER